MKYLFLKVDFKNKMAIGRLPKFNKNTFKLL